MTCCQDDQDYMGYLAKLNSKNNHSFSYFLRPELEAEFQSLFYGIELERGKKKYIQDRDVTRIRVMETHLRKNKDILLQEYRSNLQDVLDLQDTFIQDILPSVTDELELCPEAVTWVTDWLCDTCRCLLFLA